MGEGTCPSKENKFAVGSGAKTVSVCIYYYEQDNNWWVSKLIRKRHDSSVTSVAWHPNNIFLTTTSTDGKCRVLSTFIKGVDTRDSKAGSSSDSKFGEQIIQLDLSFSWVFGVKWSPSGNTLAYVGHNSMIYFVDDVGPPLAQNVAFCDLPLRDVFFVSEKMVIGVGFDCNPMVFGAEERGIWSFVRFLGERKSSFSVSKYGSQFSETFGKFYGQSKTVVSCLFGRRAVLKHCASALQDWMGEWLFGIWRIKKICPNICERFYIFKPLPPHILEYL
ncbi:actin-related protein 2/3 complex subunit 1B isoform X3 [Hevea brasiliensis]|uniref:actin-related protein 2/3 complex subunit 1B isoform X3 n=1 Tax=Hevea brasiliensis TaxID=3981 RepID=UPI0025F4C99C|nr:actin-related protein 2/3 complex subunit 1B isoform X3 [Hevea brasiliensis]